jgi:predicted enzyme related to lactoylglutathione lyase
MFCRYDLRTTDPASARRFYAEVIGLDLPEGLAAPGAPTSTLAVWPLHELARARGAPAHWLGHLAVPDVEATASRLVGLGSERLGPTLRASHGAAYATLRDPSGAVVAVREGSRRPEHPPVAWHQLHTRDVDRAWAVYAELFGWTHTKTTEVPDLEGGLRLFAWAGSNDSVGMMGNTARWPGVHAHWLFYFPVGDLDGALTRVRANGGRALAPAVALGNGDRLAPCDDAEGAAFGLYEAAPRS